MVYVLIYHMFLFVADQFVLADQWFVEEFFPANLQVALDAFLHAEME